MNWDGFGVSPETWATLVVVVALIITLLVIDTRKDVAYALVIIWAFAGIAVKQSSNQTIATLSEVSAVVVAVVLAATILLAKIKH